MGAISLYQARDCPNTACEREANASAPLGAQLLVKMRFQELAAVVTENLFLNDALGATAGDKRRAAARPRCV